MAWNAAKPANTDVISDSAADIRANWTALAGGTVPYDKHQMKNASPPASGTADSVYVYAKDANSKAELHIRDEDSNEIQLTSAGSIGSTSGAYLFDTLSHDGTTTFNEDSFLTEWGVFADDGSTTVANGLTCSRTATGKYTVTFSTAHSDTNYCVVATSGNSPNNAAMCHVPQTLKTTTAFQVWVVNGNNVGSSDFANVPFNVMVCGGR